MQKHNPIKDKWLSRLSSRLRLTNSAWKTEQAYCRTVSWGWDDADKMPKEWSRERKVEEWLSRMVRERDISASTQNCRFNALIYSFRHCYGTHVADSGQNIRSLQMALGHKSLETTMGYVHSDGLNIKSPLQPA